MNSLSTWDYQASVERVKPMVMNWRNLTVEIVEELYKAREELAKRKPLKSQSDVSNGTWDGYLRDIGLARQTVHRWLERYEPEENRILEPEELEERKRIADRAAQAKTIAIQKRVIEAIKTHKKPADWDAETEKAYQRELKERADREQRIKEATEKARADTKKREEESKQNRERWQEFDIDSEILKEATNRWISATQKRDEFKKKIRLSQSGESDLFVDALMDYLDELDSDSRRIEACQNIIKVCRNIAAELQRS